MDSVSTGARASVASRGAKRRAARERRKLRSSSAVAALRGRSGGAVDHASYSGAVDDRFWHDEARWRASRGLGEPSERIQGDDPRTQGGAFPDGMRRGEQAPRAQPVAMYAHVDDAARFRQQEPAPAQRGLSPATTLAVLFAASTFVVGSSVTAVLLYMRPVLLQMEKALKEMEVAMRSTDRATREVERASLMLEEDLSVTLEQVELASLEFEDLGHSLNSIVGRRSSAPSRRRSAADSRGSSSPSRNGSKATATTAATASRDGASRAEASASRSSSPSSSRRSRSTRSIVRQQRMRRDASRAAAVMAAADVAAGRADESVLVRTVDLDSGGEEEERSGSELTGSMDGEPARPSREKEGGSGPGLTARVVRDLQTTAAQLGSLTMGVGAMSAGALSDAMALAQRLTGSAGVWSQQIIRTAGQVNEVIAREETGRPTAKRWIASWRLRQSMDEDEDTPLPADVRPATTPPGLTLASRDAQLVITDVGPAAPAATPDVVDVAAAAATAPAAQPAEAPAATEESALVVSDAASPPDGAVIDAEVAADADGAAASEPEESDPINQDDFERMAQAFTGTIQGVLDNAQDALRARRRLTAEQEVVLALERAKDAARAAAQSSQELEDAIWRANQAGIELGDSDLREPGGGVPEDALLSDDESGMGQTWVQMLGAAWETEDEEAEEGGGPGKGRSLGSTLLAPDGGGDFYYDPGAPMGVDAATLEDDDEYWTSRAQERRRRQWKGDVYGETDDDASAAREGRGPPANQYWRED